MNSLCPQVTSDWAVSRQVLGSVRRLTTAIAQLVGIAVPCPRTHISNISDDHISLTEHERVSEVRQRGTDRPDPNRTEPRLLDRGRTDISSGCDRHRLNLATGNHTDRVCYRSSVTGRLSSRSRPWSSGGLCGLVAAVPSRRLHVHVRERMGDLGWSSTGARVDDEAWASRVVATSVGTQLRTDRGP